MTSDDQLREIIAAQAGEWLAAQRSGPLDAAGRRALYLWLTSSPLHIEEYLGVSAVARLLPVAADDAEMPLESILARINSESARAARLEPGAASSPEPRAPSLRHPWRWAAAAAVLAVLCFAVLSSNRDHVRTLRYATRHGEIGSWQLSDHSTLRLNTDSAVRVMFSRSERVVQLDQGEAFFEVAHVPGRPFRVAAGAANAMVTGTAFDVHRESGATLVTVVRGHVAVSASDRRAGIASVGAGEQVSVTDGEGPGRVMPADVERNTAWLHRQLVFEREPLAAVATEFNRYSILPIEIETAALRTVPITGVFSVDDTETFLDFLRTFPGVVVQTTSTRIRVFEPAPAAPGQSAAPPRK